MDFWSEERTHSRLCKLLEKANCVTHDHFKNCEREAKRDEQPLPAVLLQHAAPAMKHTMLEILAEYFQVPAVSLRKRVISPYVITLIPKEIAEEHGVIIFKKDKNVISVATVDPSNDQTIEFIRRKTGLEPEVYLTTPDDLSIALQRYPSEIAEEFSKIIEDGLSDAMSSRESAEEIAKHVPIMRMVDTLLSRAMRQRASDIHLEPTSEKVIIRFRIDGLLHKIVELPRAVLPALVARLKLMANVKLDEHRLPQDGRFRFAYNDREVAVRLSVIPTLHGAKVVLRLLDARGKQYTLGKLGLNSRDLVLVKQAITRPHGMILVTGPTGSGKTTTLYTVLHLLHRENVNICTVEDPVEYGVEGINQVQVNPAAGLTFASGLRALLRQDPDIVMVGEIRDSETAEIAVNAAMTGHLVLSTLHTNTAFHACQRLGELGVAPFLLGSVVNLIIAQRLVRTLCPSCRVRLPSARRSWDEYQQTLELNPIVKKLKLLGLLPENVLADIPPLFHGRGCNRCGSSGYQGRIGIYEVVQMDEGLAEVVSAGGAAAEAVRQYALKQGGLTMFEDGVLKVLKGVTTFDEVLRVTKE